ncbi:MAG: hypothetical protein NTW19_24560 [Planctomycetota bacterium]|nr:hypothetical protein [Planctomycetota bacterium]
MHALIASRLALVIFFIVVFWPTPGLAIGLSDYTLPIDSRYQICQANGLDVVLAKTDGKIVLRPRDHPALGPIFEYVVTPSFIFTRHYGRTPRNDFPGDTFENVDRNSVFLCITRKEDGLVTGPFSQSDFDSEPAVKNTGAISWRKLENPSNVVPSFGLIDFVEGYLAYTAVAASVLALSLFIVLKARAGGRQPTRSS